MTIKIGTAPDSWGVWFPENDQQIPWDRALDEMAKAGYAGIELGPWGYLPNDPETLKTELSKRELELVAATCGTNFLDDEASDKLLQTIDEIVALLDSFEDTKYIVLLPDMYTDLLTGEQTMNPKLTDDEKHKLIANIQKVSDYISSKGYVACLHPHVDSHVETEEEIEYILNNTNDNVQLCFDTGHHVYGGGEPISFYEKYQDRIPFIHIKDCDLEVKKVMDDNKWSFAKAVTEDIMTEPGQGTIDFVAFRQVLLDNNYSGWLVVEQDLFPVKSFDIPFEIAKRTREYLSSIGFNSQ